MKNPEIAKPSITTDNECRQMVAGKTIYTAGRPPWYDASGQLRDAFVIGVAGGSDSGKTTVARKIIEELGVPWVVLLDMDSFYKSLTMEQAGAGCQE